MYQRERGILRIFLFVPFLYSEDLTERDTDMSGIIQFKDYQETLERTCDVVKKMAYGVEFAVLGIESQQKSIMQCHCELCCMTLWDI